MKLNNEKKYIKAPYKLKPGEIAYSNYQSAFAKLFKNNPENLECADRYYKIKRKEKE